MKCNSAYIKKMIAGFVLLFSIVLSGCNQYSERKQDAEASSSDKIVRIGYQKNCPLVILKSLGTLEKQLEKKGVKVEWKEFQAGPALLEALNAGSVDFGRTGDSPPIFAQAADSPIVYVAAGYSKFKGSGILVPKESTIQSLNDLKGKKIGFAKGSSSHYLLVKALEKAGLEYGDITPAYLQPGDARVAFEQGNIDAWVVWDPFASDTELNSEARMLVNGEGLTSDRDFFIANANYAKSNKEILNTIVDQVQESSEWANSHHEELVSMLAPLLKIDENSIEMAVKRREYGVDPLSDEIMKEQQEKADTFYQLKIIPKEIVVKDALLD
ncbi:MULTISPECIES: sulfonate ABC transporter substrate-binding protein [unclassified Bacillus (in: firmicutes)]|uniref:sulfonate ABC transporter substrate-binding protein n=1 Tax=unclassified Bacillus (in: firmicutes) TaxID=185979 RepID=UPI001BE727A3|nr:MULTISPECIES: sulfonate ABC transporter substrate-binding protein [unclassified Bacillus (in: firmicutes)]MBT2637866.1 sulfonate ABC transporter substrate-binding protein [Bacillus sp. ISL-39]MBT2661038.1 sulfonate ABC transporter substrate-binding protein [Bacillus sp. ISL-45]